MTDRRPSSVKVRRACFEYWRYSTPHGWRMTCQCGCKTEFNPATASWEAEHEIVRAHGGSDDPPNVRPFLTACHKIKTKDDVSRIAKAQRQSNSIYGVKRSSGSFPCGKNSRFKKKISGEIVER